MLMHMSLYTCSRIDMETPYICDQALQRRFLCSTATSHERDPTTPKSTTQRQNLFLVVPPPMHMCAVERRTLSLSLDVLNTSGDRLKKQTSFFVRVRHARRNEVFLLKKRKPPARARQARGAKQGRESFFKQHQGKFEQDTETLCIWVGGVNDS
jgi:hypothetical protein